MIRLLVSIVAVLLSAACNHQPTDTTVEDNELPRYPQVVTESGAVIEVEVASTPEARARGLMYRRVLPENRGMVFLFPEPTPQTFWMKNTLISLDIIWIDEESRVIEIVTAPPCTADPCPSYGPEEIPASWVLEIAGGEAERLGIKRGTKLELRNVERLSSSTERNRATESHS